MGSVLRGRLVDRVQALRTPERPGPHARQGAHRGFPRFLRGERHRDNISDEVLGGKRAAFNVDVILPDGKRVFEHTIVHLEDGKTTRQEVDVEA